MNFRPSHIPFDRLVDWVEKKLPVANQTQVQAHLAVCAQCQGEVDQIERMLNAMQLDMAVDPPPPVVSRALRLFDHRVVERPSLLQRMVAALQFDSLTLTPALGLRSGAAAPRQLLFNAGDYDLDLRLVPAEQAEQWLLSGQLLGANPTTGSVLGAGPVTVHTALSPLGEFALPAVPSGTYTLTVQLAEAEIVLGPLTL